jgi:hypothetical protein
MFERLDAGLQDQTTQISRWRLVNRDVTITPFSHEATTNYQQHYTPNIPIVIMGIFSLSLRLSRNLDCLRSMLLKCRPYGTLQPYEGT